MSTAVPLLNSTQLLDHLGQVVKMPAWVVSRRDKTLSSGKLQIQLILGDGYDSVIGYVWPEHRDHVGPITTEAPALVTAKVREFDRRPNLEIRQICPIDPSEIDCAATLLPSSACPAEARDGLSMLVELEQALPDPLSGFLKRVLLDPAIGLPLLRCRASVSHHHSYAGGLLAHCTSLLDIAGGIAAAALPDDPLAAPMAQLGYLLHDLGKLRSVGEECRPEDPFVLRHETMTVEFLTPHLYWLERQDRELGLGLRYVLQYLATPHASRGIAEYLVAEIVVFLDHCSAASKERRDLSSLLRRRPVSWGPAKVATKSVGSNGGNGNG
ncbi:hypothetical protein [Solimonas sp. SE-A11]|uniref:hypothetical protein n=1 Tax=Solimonas sp. SE-A11 TaxID=3054954 RepID=UPI00259CAEB8|nr:hypothetical protein [Solimonas sp. SE-A11]MDM4771163.1 hypothetical protein [Solimonas sp. SE-A11]